MGIFYISIPKNNLAPSPIKNATMVTIIQTVIIRAKCGQNGVPQSLDLTKLKKNIIAAPITYVIPSARRVCVINRNGINNIHVVNRKVIPVDAPCQIAASESPSRLAKYSEAVIDNAALTDAIIPVNNTTFGDADAKTKPVISPVIDTIASCIPRIIQSQK